MIEVTIISNKYDSEIRSTRLKFVSFGYNSLPRRQNVDSLEFTLTVTFQSSLSPSPNMAPPRSDQYTNNGAVFALGYNVTKKAS